MLSTSKRILYTLFNFLTVHPCDILIHMSQKFYNDSIYWVEVEKVQPNPFQPRKEFNQERLQDLSDSIRQYGVLQPLVVTRHEHEQNDGGIKVHYELIAGERRLRASKLAGLTQVPVIIRASDETDKMKLELAIIENLQREDLNPVDRAKAFQQLVDDFKMKHTEVAKKVGRSREYVSNTLRLLNLPEHIKQALTVGNITEGHARPLLMLTERKAEQETLFKEIQAKKLTVRETERIARRIATDRARKKDLTPELLSFEKELSDSLGTRVQIEQKKNGGKVHIDFFSAEDLQHLLETLSTSKEQLKSASGVAGSLTAVGLFTDKKEDTPNIPSQTKVQEQETLEATPHQPENTVDFPQPHTMEPVVQTHQETYTNPEPVQQPIAPTQNTAESNIPTPPTPQQWSPQQTPITQSTQQQPEQIQTPPEPTRYWSAPKREEPTPAPAQLQQADAFVEDIPPTPHTPTTQPSPVNPATVQQSHPIHQPIQPQENIVQHIAQEAGEQLDKEEISNAHAHYPQQPHSTEDDEDDMHSVANFSI